VGDLDKDYDVSRLVELIYSKKLCGYFWSTIDELDKDELTRRISASDRSLRGILGSIMELRAATSGKSRCGAKFPVHYSYADKLLEWFPDCKLLHTTRDPRAIYVSQSNKYTSGDYSAAKNAWIRYQHFSHINIQTVWTASIHRRFRARDNYMLSRYEDLLADPKKHMQAVCEFLEIDFNENMAEPTLHSNSSFNDMYGQGRGLQKSSVDSWKVRINPLADLAIKGISGRAMKLFGY
jgi:hypothetical protein